MTDEPINPEYKDFVRSQFSNAGFCPVGVKRTE